MIKKGYVVLVFCVNLCFAGALSKDTIVGGSHTINVGANNKLRVAN